MSLQDWERDIINRQRNIVFPDTILNEGRFYRNIASGKAVFTTAQRVSLLAIVLFFVVVNAVDLASAIGSPRKFLRGDVWPAIGSAMWLAFWIFLTVKAIFPPPKRLRKIRRGYRSCGERT